MRGGGIGGRGIPAVEERRESPMGGICIGGIPGGLIISRGGTPSGILLLSSILSGSYLSIATERDHINVVTA